MGSPAVPWTTRRAQAARTLKRERTALMAQKSKRGFAAMDPMKQRQIASKGGKAAHQKGTAHEFTPEEARAAGRKGGQAAHERGRAHEFTPEEARAAGRKGGLAAHERNRASSNAPPAAPNGAHTNLGTPPPTLAH